MARNLYKFNRSKGNSVKPRISMLAAAALLLVSCGRSAGRNISLPADPPLSGGMGFALVKASYIRLKAEPSVRAADLGNLRDGTLVELVGRELGLQAEDEAKAGAEAEGLWYRVRVVAESSAAKASGQAALPAAAGQGGSAAAGVLEGWVRDAELEVFATRSQAERAASKAQAR